MSPNIFISHGKYFFLLLIPVLFLMSCSILSSEENQTTGCILQEIKYDEFNSLKFQTILGGRMYTVSQEFADNDKVSIVASYQFRYSENRITVIDQKNSNALYPYLSIELEGESPKQILRYFPLSGVLLFHDFSYPEENLIRVDLTREASTGDILYVG